MTKNALDTPGFTLAQLPGSRNITVNTVAPGVAGTDVNARILDAPEAGRRAEGMIALGRRGRPGDLADMVAFFVSHDARWITGGLVDAAGGMHLGPGDGGAARLRRGLVFGRGRDGAPALVQPEPSTKPWSGLLGG
jgi:3-oxoacyl-[acyl-carrier protein] reductase